MNCAQNGYADEKVVKFFPETRETHLEFLVWYRGSDGRNRWVSGVVNNYGFKEAQDLRHYILRHMTDYVRSQWCRMEVTTPKRLESYSSVAGGHVRLIIERTPPSH